MTDGVSLIKLDDLEFGHKGCDKNSYASRLLFSGVSLVFLTEYAEVYDYHGGTC